MTHDQQEPPAYVLRAVRCLACNAEPEEPCTRPTDTGRTPVTWVHLERYKTYLDRTTPQTGDWATHRYQDLDPRRVASVSEDGKSIFLYLLADLAGPFPAENYWFTRGEE